jgi:hypothetical protein
MAPDARAQLAGFLAKYTRKMAAEARDALARLRRLVPGACELVYDNYNALVIGFGPSARASDAVVSLAVYPRWVTLCFLQGGPELPDPDRLLKGSGRVVRHVVLQSAADLEKPAIRVFIRTALERADMRIDRAARARLIIKSISAKQRPRRPVSNGGSGQPRKDQSLRFESARSSRITKSSRVKGRTST